MFKGVIGVFFIGRVTEHTDTLCWRMKSFLMLHQVVHVGTNPVKIGMGNKQTKISPIFL
jgi:hypothetical protein